MEDITNAQRIYLQQHVTKVEHVMAGAAYADPVIGYRKWIDQTSIADYIIVNEWSKNPDAYRLSTFFYKERDDRGGKIFAGPVWDFNLGFGNVDYCTNGDPYGLVIQNFNQICPDDYWVIHFWWKKWMEDKKLVESIQDRWQSLRQSTLSDQRMEFMIDSLATHLHSAQRRNFTKWPVLGQYVWPNYFVGSTYKEEVEYLKGWLRERMAFLDMIWGSPVAAADMYSSEMSVFPNPSHGSFRCMPENNLNELTGVFLTDITGKQYTVPFSKVSDNEYEIQCGTLPPSIYNLRIETSDKIFMEKVVIQP